MLVDVLEEHLEEAGDLLARRPLAFAMLDLDGADLADLDGRLRAHLDGLVLGGETAWPAGAAALADGARGPVAAATVLALEADVAAGRAALAQLLAQPPSHEAVAGVAEGCCLARGAPVEPLLRQLLAGDAPAGRAVALEALGFRRVHPGPALAEALAGGTPDEVLAAARAAGRLREVAVLPAVAGMLAHDDPAVAAAALESLAYLDPVRARAACLEALDGAGPAAANAALLLGALARPEDVPRLVAAASTPAEEAAPVARAALLALGHRGDPAGIPALIDALAREDSGPAAAVALGLALGDLIPREETAPTDAEDDDGADWTPDDDLPRLAAGPVATWWREQASSFPDGARLRVGRPHAPADRLDPATPLPLLELEAIELAATHPGRHPPEPRAPRA